MNISPFEMYLIVKATDVMYLLVLAGMILLIIGALILYAHAIGEWPTSYKTYILLIIGTILLILGILIPSTKQIAAIYVVPHILNNEQVQELPNEFLGLAKDWIEELKPTKEEVE